MIGKKSIHDDSYEPFVRGELDPQVQHRVPEVQYAPEFDPSTGLPQGGLGKDEERIPETSPSWEGDYWFHGTQFNDPETDKRPLHPTLDYLNPEDTHTGDDYIEKGLGDLHPTLKIDFEDNPNADAESYDMYGKMDIDKKNAGHLVGEPKKNVELKQYEPDVMFNTDIYNVEKNENMKKLNEHIDRIKKLMMEQEGETGGEVAGGVEVAGSEVAGVEGAGVEVSKGVAGKDVSKGVEGAGLKGGEVSGFEVVDSKGGVTDLSKSGESKVAPESEKTAEVEQTPIVQRMVKGAESKGGSSSEKIGNESGNVTATLDVPNDVIESGTLGKFSLTNKSETFSLEEGALGFISFNTTNPKSDTTTTHTFQVRAGEKKGSLIMQKVSVNEKGNTVVDKENIYNVSFNDDEGETINFGKALEASPAAGGGLSGDFTTGELTASSGGVTARADVPTEVSESGTLGKFTLSQDSKSFSLEEGAEGFISFNTTDPKSETVTVNTFQVKPGAKKGTLVMQKVSLNDKGKTEVDKNLYSVTFNDEKGNTLTFDKAVESSTEPSLPGGVSTNLTLQKSNALGSGVLATSESAPEVLSQGISFDFSKGTPTFSVTDVKGGESMSATLIDGDNNTAVYEVNSSGLKSNGSFDSDTFQLTLKSGSDKPLGVTSPGLEEKSGTGRVYVQSDEKVTPFTNINDFEIDGEGLVKSITLNVPNVGNVKYSPAKDSQLTEYTPTVASEKFTASKSGKGVIDEIEVFSVGSLEDFTKDVAVGAAEVKGGIGASRQKTAGIDRAYGNEIIASSKTALNNISNLEKQAVENLRAAEATGTLEDKQALEQQISDIKQIMRDINKTITDTEIFMSGRPGSKAPKRTFSAAASPGLSTGPSGQVSASGEDSSPFSGGGEEGEENQLNESRIKKQMILEDIKKMKRLF